MILRITSCLLILGSIVVACESTDAEESPSTVQVECVGKLRLGQVAIGGETTGTTVSFDGTTWELKLTNPESLAVAKMLHKKSVVVTGILRHVRGTEVSSRWVVDVEKLKAHEAETKTTSISEGAKISLKGILKYWTDSSDSTKDRSGMTVSSGGITWHLDFTGNRELETASKLLDGELVSVKGSFFRSEASKQGGVLNLKVNALTSATTK